MDKKVFKGIEKHCCMLNTHRMYLQIARVITFTYKVED